MAEEDLLVSGMIAVILTFSGLRDAIYKLEVAAYWNLNELVDNMLQYLSTFTTPCDAPDKQQLHDDCSSQEVVTQWMAVQEQWVRLAPTFAPIDLDIGVPSHERIRFTDVSRCAVGFDEDGRRISIRNGVRMNRRIRRHKTAALPSSMRVENDISPTWSLGSLALAR